MTQRYPRIYAALKKFGFSAANALTILFDAKRGNDGAMIAVKLAVRK